MPSALALALDRRATSRQYDAVLPEFHPVKLMGAFVGVDFVVGCGPSAAGLALDTRVSPRKVLSWLRSMPSYRAGVPVRIGHQTDAALEFEKSAELIELVEPRRSVVYQTRTPFTARERDFLKTPRPNLLIELNASPRRRLPASDPGARELVASAASLDPSRLHWMIGPLGATDLDEASGIVEALPPGSRLTLAPLQPSRGQVPMDEEGLARLEALALSRGQTVSDWSCRNGPARVGRGFFDVDRITAQADLARRAQDLITCYGCPSRTQCHGVLDQADVLGRLPGQLEVLGLELTAPPTRTGPHAFALQVDQPTAPGDEAFLSHALGHPVAFSLSPGAPSGSQDPAVLRRWYRTGFLPVTELNRVAELVLEDLQRREKVRRPGAASLLTEQRSPAAP
jgi:hypothetical protein